MADGANTLKSVLSTNYVDANADGVTPTIDLVIYFDTVGGGNRAYDTIMLHSLNYLSTPNSIGSSTKRITEIVRIDVRSSKPASTLSDKRVHAIKVRDEVERVLDSKMNSVGGDFDYMEPGEWRDISDKRLGECRYVWEGVQMVKLNKARGT